MKLRKLLMCLLAAAVISGGSAVSAMAAETDTSVLAVEDATKEGSADSTQDLPVEGENTAQTSQPEETIDTDATPEEKETAETEEIEETEKEEKEKSSKKAEAKKKTVKEEKESYTKAELRLLAALISCEAGSEPYAGKLAVGIVVVNREESSRFPNSVKNVIYQKYQFGPARNGSLKAALARYDNGKFTSSNDKDCIKAAKAALSGEKKVSYKGKEINMKSYLFFSGRVSGARLTIGNHQFK